MPTMDGYWRLRLFTFDPSMNLTCNLCGQSFILMLTHVRDPFTWAELDGAILEHVVRYHPDLTMSAMMGLAHSQQNLSQDPQEQPQGREVHPGSDAGGGQQEAQCRANQQDQYYDRHVDPLSLRPRFET